MATLRRRRLATLSGLAGALAVAVVVAARGPELFEALAACSPVAALAAIGVHAATLAGRCEAWRIAVGAIKDEPVGRVAAHAAGGVGSAAGMLQGAGTAPVRAIALRRLAPESSPSVKQLVVAELPIFLIEAALIAVVLGLAILALPLAPAWAPPVALAASAGALLALRAWNARIKGTSAGAGLRVLGDRGRRGHVLGLLVAVTGLGVLRAWLVLAGLGLPHGAATAALVFIALGVLGVLPIGPGSTPVAMLAVVGSADPTVALAAGIAVTATSWLGVALYASAGAAAWAVGERSASRRSSASRVDQPKWRAASPSPSSGL